MSNNENQGDADIARMIETTRPGDRVRVETNGDFDSVEFVTGKVAIEEIYPHRSRYEVWSESTERVQFRASVCFKDEENDAGDPTAVLDRLLTNVTPLHAELVECSVVKPLGSITKYDITEES